MLRNKWNSLSVSLYLLLLHKILNPKYKHVTNPEELNVRNLIVVSSHAFAVRYRRCFKEQILRIPRSRVQASTLNKQCTKKQEKCTIIIKYELTDQWSDDRWQTLLKLDMAAEDL